jgi:hypothetical protein
VFARRAARDFHAPAEGRRVANTSERPERSAIPRRPRPAFLGALCSLRSLREIRPWTDVANQDTI